MEDSQPLDLCPPRELSLKHSSAHSAFLQAAIRRAVLPLLLKIHTLKPSLQQPQGG